MTKAKARAAREADRTRQQQTASRQASRSSESIKDKQAGIVKV